MSDPLTPYGNKPMVTPIVYAVNYHYQSFEALRQITDGEIDGYTYHRDDNPTVRAIEKKVAAMEYARRFIEILRIIHHAVSPGATEPLIRIPRLTAMLYMPPERRADSESA